MRVPFPALKTMVTVFLMLMGYTSPVVLSSITPNMVIKVASEVVTPGKSLNGGTLQDLAEDYGVTCAIEVENWTRYSLMAPRLRIGNDGAATTLPVAIEPGKREAFAVRKASSVRKGVYGTVSWEVELDGENRRFVLMWSAPYDFNRYSNWMGLGMTKEGLVDVPLDNTWFNQMYYDSSDASLTFVRKEFYYNTDPFMYKNEKFEVDGVMTNGHHALVRVVILPTSNNWEDLAYDIRRKLD